MNIIVSLCCTMMIIVAMRIILSMILIVMRITSYVYDYEYYVTPSILPTHQLRAGPSGSLVL